MANKKKHLLDEERFCIEKMLGVGKSYGEIARTLGRGLSTISEEVNGNGGRDKYKAERVRKAIQALGSLRSCIKLSIIFYFANMALR